MKKGMDPEAVRALAGRVEELGENVMQNYELRLNQVNELDWTGEDQQQYISQFESEVGNAARTCQQQLTEFAERLRQNADAQDQASN
ncbi:WXG100 family type VII secretion target [Brachybacterium timonense]|uniref:WXG100 family type VII secretion target n=1 Tax=Brachybacterium timonense TaxID=2050896 RepID=UPI000D0B4D5D|nr:WXG100 family type VII secretion target [Brachybacterium timonense]